MNLLLWRHAEAEDTWPDSERRLTERGEEHARLVAGWIRKHVPGDLRVFSSPALRCRQTAETLGCAVEVDQGLDAGSDVAQILLAAGWNAETPGTTVVVGHQPLLGQTAAFVLSGREIAWSVAKGAVWWLSVGKGGRVTLKALIAPEFV
ncbi:MAG: histidine phosphatase family protein [Candidatus Accumulibacter sp.]|nr:histidine phosphatase family protein [Accumulibacter sp.]